MAETNSSTGSGFPEREFPMTQRDFDRIRDIAYKMTGITLSDHKKNMVYGRLARRLRRLNLTDFSTYCDIVEQKKSPEKTEFVNAITTNLTSFFRENHHFEYLKEEFIPNLIKINSTSRRIRIWSAGCSTGEEPYSIAMVFRSFAQLNDWDVKILATDLDSNVVATGKAGRYSIERVEGLSAEYQNYIKAAGDDKIDIVPKVKSLITFKQLNLLKQWPMKGPFDAIFCRNVVIYFNNETQKVLFNRYADILSPDGKLFIGHSESLHNVTQRFRALGKTIYERSD